MSNMALSAGACSWQGNKDVQEDRFALDIELEGPQGERLALGKVIGAVGSLSVGAGLPPQKK